jgi:serine/threonine protein phosphatase PrpC
MFTLRIATRTDVGPQRDDNEDGVFVDERQRVCAVFDGMGGQRTGWLATQIAEQSLSLFAAQPRSLGSLELEARAAATAVHDAVAAANGVRYDGALVTAVIALWSDRELAFAHAGDTLAMLVRDGRSERLTERHDLRWYARITGVFDPSPDSLGQKYRNVVTNTLGMVNREQQGRAAPRFTPYAARPDTVLVELALDDRYVLCSNGLYDALSDDEIAAIVHSAPSEQSACDALVELACARDTEDNVSALVATVVRATSSSSAAL